MKIISWNVNGIRAVYKKNFLNWLASSKAEIVCLQEIKAQKEQLPNNLLEPKGYCSYFNQAIKKGYSGIVIYTKQKPLKVEDKLGIKRFDQEGRILKLKYPGFILINLYLPHGGRQKENLHYKLKVYRHLLDYLKKIKNENVVLVGDFNVARQEIDLERSAQNKTMGLPRRLDQVNLIIWTSY